MLDRAYGKEMAARLAQYLQPCTYRGIPPKVLFVGYDDYDGEAEALFCVSWPSIGDSIPFGVEVDVMSYVYSYADSNGIRVSPVPDDDWTIGFAFSVN
jgi:hypothetical protein